MKLFINNKTVYLDFGGYCIFTKNYSSSIVSENRKIISNDWEFNIEWSASKWSDHTNSHIFSNKVSKFVLFTGLIVLPNKYSHDNTFLSA
jgi:hypothetical protein